MAGLPPASNSPVPIYTPGQREALLEQRALFKSPDRVRTQTPQYGDERTNHEATAPPSLGQNKFLKKFGLGSERFEITSP